MCGIVGIFTSDKTGLYSHDKESFRQMMILNSLRGIDSTGFMGISKDDKENSPYIVKSTGSPYVLYDWVKTDEFFSKMIQKFALVVGHSRYATKGDVNAMNAHPFEEEHITLVHNGVINNFYGLRDYQKHGSIDVDSHLIARLFAEEGADAVLPEISGAFVFVWWDAIDHTLNIARNTERPLWIGRAKDKEKIVFASEPATLAWNAMRNNFPLIDMKEVEPFKVFSYSRDSITPTVTPFQPFQTKTVVYYNKTENKEEATKKIEHKDSLRQVIKDNTQILKVGDEIEFDIQDVDTSGNVMFLTGNVKSLPEVTFRARWNGPEESAYNCDSVQGKVASIYHLSDPVDGAIYRAFLADVVLITNSGEEFVTFADESKMSRRRYVQLCDETDCKCGWCNNAIDPTHPEKLTVAMDHLKNNILLCEECSSYEMKQ